MGKHAYPVRDLRAFGLAGGGGGRMGHRSDGNWPRSRKWWRIEHAPAQISHGNEVNWNRSSCRRRLRRTAPRTAARKSGVSKKQSPERPLSRRCSPLLPTSAREITPQQSAARLNRGPSSDLCLHRVRRGGGGSASTNQSSDAKSAGWGGIVERDGHDRAHQSTMVAAGVFLRA